MTDLNRQQSNLSKKAEIFNYYYQWQFLEAQWKKEGKEKQHQMGQRRI
jgi:hypothetical protein